MESDTESQTSSFSKINADDDSVLESQSVDFSEKFVVSSENVLSESISRSNNIHKNILVSNNKSYENYYTVSKTTLPFLTKYEKAKLIGVRAQQISYGSPVMVTVPKGITNAYDIAMKEFEEKKIPILIRRYLPNGSYEDWRLEDMTTV